jgi:rubrerythrin
MFKKTVENFTCENCGFKVKGTGFTDHCPKCLASKHVDIEPGDRLSKCKGLMLPISADYSRHEFKIVYKCTKCGLIKKVSAAPADDKEKLEFLASLKKTSLNNKFK